MNRGNVAAVFVAGLACAAVAAPAARPAGPFDDGPGGPPSPRGGSGASAAPKPQAPPAATAPAARVARPAREPVPSPAELADADRLVRDVFKADYARPGPTTRRALAAKLLAKAAAPGERPAVRYALLREARALAADDGDYPAARRAADATAAGFAVPDARAPRREAMAVAAPSVDPASAAALVADALAAVDDALDRGEPAAARELAAVAGVAAARGADRALAARAADKGRDARAAQEDEARAAEAAKVLAARPDDPAANLAVGRHLCFDRGDWPAGLAALAKGSDADLRALAARDLAGAATPEARLAVGDAWRDRAKAEPSTAPRRRAIARAERWYLDALAGAQGLARTAAAGRLRESPGGVSFAALAARWAGPRLRTDLSQWGRPGGNADAAPSPGLLVGFEYRLSVWTGRKMVKVLRPVYLTEQGRLLGRQYGHSKGDADGTAPPLTALEARPGYAVGGVAAFKDERLRGFRVTFMRVYGDRLNPDDRYESEWVGWRPPADPVPLGADGRAVVGVQAASGEDVDALGLILLE